MKWNSVIFIIGFLIAFAGGYFFFGTGKDAPAEDPAEEPSTEEAEEVDESAMDIPEEAHSLSRNGCLGCHSVEALGIEAGNIGPDLTIAHSIVEGKHGKNLDEFLQDPTSAVMATVIADNPIEDDEREEILGVLKKASEENDQQPEQEQNEDTSND